VQSPDTLILKPKEKIRQERIARLTSGGLQPPLILAELLAAKKDWDVSNEKFHQSIEWFRGSFYVLLYEAMARKARKRNSSSKSNETHRRLGLRVVAPWLESTEPFLYTLLLAP